MSLGLESLERELFKQTEGITYEEITKEFLQGGKNIPFKTEIDHPVNFSILETFVKITISQLTKYLSVKEKERVNKNMKAYLTGNWDAIQYDTENMNNPIDNLLYFMMSLKINMISKERLSRKETADILRAKKEEEKEEKKTLDKLMEKL